MDLDAFSKLEAWRESVFNRDLDGTPLDPTAVLDNDMITKLVSAGNLSPRQVDHLLQGSWIWWERYGSELCDLISSMNIVYTKKEVRSKTKLVAERTTTSYGSQDRNTTAVEPPPQTPIPTPRSTSKRRHQSSVENANTALESVPGSSTAVGQSSQTKRVRWGSQTSAMTTVVPQAASSSTDASRGEDSFGTEPVSPHVPLVRIPACWKYSKPVATAIGYDTSTRRTDLVRFSCDSVR